MTVTMTRIQDRPRPPDPVPDPVIGLDVGSAGRLVRVLVACGFLALILSSVWRQHAVAAFEPAGVAFLGFAAAYTALVLALGERLLPRLDGWSAALVLLAPGTILTALPFVPSTVGLGFYLYIAAGLIVQAAIGYGGCEIVGIPMLVLRRRYRVYCALNGADVVERWLQRRSGWARWGMTLLALAATGGLVTLAEVVTPAWLRGYDYLLFLAVGFIINRLLVRPESERTCC